MPWIELLVGLMGVIMMLLGGVWKAQASRIKDLEDFNDRVHEHWENDAKTYLLKKDFASFAEDIKDALVRIEDKIEKLRD